MAGTDASGAEAPPRRVLITGLSSFWGGRVAQALEADPSVETIVGLDTDEPRVELERTEFVRTDENYSIMARLVKATQVDTVLHAGLIVDSTRSGAKRIHESNVIGTMNLLAAVGAEDSAVRTLVVKSSTLVYGATPRDPYWFDERASRVKAPVTRIERTLLEVESYLKAFREDHAKVRVAVLRCANVLGGELVTPLTTALSLPLVPRIAGFDPQLQFVEETDVVRAILFTLRAGLSGAYNVAGDGKLPWSEVIAIAGKQAFLLPPILTSLAASPLARIRIVDLPPEILDLLRYGRGVDNGKMRKAGFTYRYTSAEAVRHLIEGQRLAAVVGSSRPSYTYEADVEAFFRHSPAVVPNA